MNTKEAKQSVQMDKALFDFYGKPSIGQSLPLAIQHVLAMIVGCVTPSIIVAGVAGLSPVSYTHLDVYKRQQKDHTHDHDIFFSTTVKENR